MVKKIKSMTITGTIWDFWPILKLTDTVTNAKFISFYKPWLKGDISSKNIILFNEKSSNILLWPFKLLFRTIKIIRQVKKNKIQVVITHHDEANVSLIPTLFFYKLFSKKRKPLFVFWIRNNPFETYKEGLFSKVILFSYKYFYKYADVLVIQTKQNAESIAKVYPKLESKMKIFPNVYDLKKNKLLSEAPITNTYSNIFKSSKFTFITIGRLTLQKNQWSLIRAFSKLYSENKNIQLVIIGQGELEVELKTLAKNLSVESAVYFLGKQENPFQFLGKSNCFVFPSLWEGMPNTLIEALSLNLPVIASDCVSGPREILTTISTTEIIKYPYYGEYGILIPLFDRKTEFRTLREKGLNSNELILYSSMKTILSNESYRAKYSRGIDCVKKYDISNLKSMFLKLFE
jgi:glycosyltransferase involved in cell wall biosynthesis